MLAIIIVSYIRPRESSPFKSELSQGTKAEVRPEIMITMGDKDQPPHAKALVLATTPLKTAPETVKRTFNGEFC